MSWSALHTQLLLRRASCLLNSGPAVLTKTALSCCRHLRPSSSKPSSRPAGSSASVASDVVAVPKKKISTKSTTSTATKTPRSKARATAATAEAGDAAIVPPKKNARAASTKTASSVQKKKVEVPMTSTSKAPTSTRASPTDHAPVTSGAKRTASTTAKSRTPAPSKNVASAPIKVSGSPRATSASTTATARGVPISPTARVAVPPAPGGPTVSPESPKKVDVSSPEYKRASRKFTSVMVALPILLVTSYFLFDRLALGNLPKSLESFRSPITPKEEKPASDA